MADANVLNMDVSGLFHRNAYHPPLNADGSEIRLLTAMQDGTCRLKTSKLESSDFVALSYAWGLPQDKIYVHVNPPFSTPVLIPTSLSDALSVFSEKFYSPPFEMLPPVKIWADAICINQNDPNERSQQVTAMGNIFKAADKVWIWIGLGGEKEDLAFRTLQRWGDQCPSPEDWEQSEVEAIQHVLQKPWWSRLWTLQEVVLARDAWLICGDNWLSWTKLQMLNNRWLYLQTESRSVTHSMILSNLITETWSMKMQRFDEGPERTSLVTLLEQTAFFDTTDPRDKVYALVGLAAELPGFRVDYRASVREVFRSLAISEMARSKSLNILLSAGLNPGENQWNFPSWVPDWTTQRKRPAPIPPTHPFMFMMGLPDGVQVIGEDTLRVIGHTITTIKTRGVTFDIISGHHRSFLDDWLHTILKPEIAHLFRRPLDDLYKLIAVNFHLYGGTKIRKYSFAKRLAESHSHALTTYLPALKRHTPGPDFVAAVWREMGEDELPLLDDSVETELSTWVQYMVWICQFRCLFVTHSGQMGLGPSTLQEDDCLVRLQSCDSLLIIRQIGDFRVLVGEGYASISPSDLFSERLDTFDLI